MVETGQSVVVVRSMSPLEARMEVMGVMEDPWHWSQIRVWGRS